MRLTKPRKKRWWWRWQLVLHVQHFNRWGEPRDGPELIETMHFFTKRGAEDWLAQNKYKATRYYKYYYELERVIG